MKKKKLALGKKLFLNKESLVLLNIPERNHIVGGGFTEDEHCIRPITVTSCRNDCVGPLTTSPELQGGTMCGTLNPTVLSCVAGPGCAISK